MAGTIELDTTGTLLLIRFGYREDLVGVIRELPDRRWEPRSKVWTVPAAHVEAVVSRLMGFGFTMDAGVSAMFAGTVPLPPVPPPARRGKPAARGRGRGRSASDGGET